MLTILADTRTLIESNRAMLAATHARIARCRRKLNPAFGVSGAAAPPLRVTVRKLLDTGMLPPAGAKVMAGHGSGKRCLICHEPVTAEEVEYEVDDGGAVCHLLCFRVWREETVHQRSGL